jgi:hypothetical protein
MDSQPTVQVTDPDDYRSVAYWERLEDEQAA